MGLDLFRLLDVPHVEPLGEDDHRPLHPIVVDEELARVKTVYLHVLVEVLVGVGLQQVELPLERFFVEVQAGVFPLALVLLTALSVRLVKVELFVFTLLGLKPLKLSREALGLEIY